MSPLTLLIVITFILGAQSYTPYKEFDPYPFGSPNSCGPISSTWVNAVSNALPVAQRSQLNTNATELSAFAEDYGHIYHRAPQVAFLARNTDDVVALVRAAKQLRNGANRFQIVPRGGSGNVQGGAQVSCDVKQVLLDTTGLSSVSITNLPLQKFAWLGAGTPWLDFITAAAAVNLRPRVNPDYAGLTVGGLISAGGLGPDTAHVGPAVDQVLELEIVTPTGNRRLVGPRDEYFKAIRGGLGQFGIVTAVKYKLIANEADTRVYHVLTGNWTAYFATLQKFVDVLIPSKVDTVQSFVISNAEFNLEIFVAPAADLDAVRANVDAVLALPQPWVYFLELTIRGSENFLTTAQIGALLPEGMDPLLVFYTDEPTMSFDNRLKLFTVPALTANNGSWFKRHPWGSFCFPDSQIANFKTVIDNFDAFADSGFGLIAVYPYKTTKFSQNSFLSVPRTDDHFYHVTFGNNELTDTDAGLAHIAQKNRDIWDLLADTTIYPTIYIPDFGPTDWAKHFGTHWNQVKRIKKRLDPYFLLGDQRNFGFASLY